MTQGSKVVFFCIPRAIRQLTFCWVPNVVGKTPAEAKFNFSQRGFERKKIKGVSKSGKNATCIGQSPV